MNEPVMRVEKGQTALFGYGSLCSIASLERTLGRKYEGPYLNCQVEGWRRSWDAAMPNKAPDRAFYYETPEGRVFPEYILYLNVRRVPGSLLNGTIFVLDDDEVKRFDGREWIYDRTDVTDAVRGVRVEGGEAHLYVAKPEYVVQPGDSPKRAAIRRTYIAILEDAFRDLGKDFRDAYERSSDTPPEHLVIADQVSQ